MATALELYKDRLIRAGNCIQVKERILNEACEDTRIDEDGLLDLIQCAYPDREVSGA